MSKTITMNYEEYKQELRDERNRMSKAICKEMLTVLNSPKRKELIQARIDEIISDADDDEKSELEFLERLKMVIV